MCHAEAIKGVRNDDEGLEFGALTIPAGNEQMPAYLCRPAGSEPVPGVLIIHDVWGANEFYQQLCRRLAREGFLALLPNLFFRAGELAEQTIDAARTRAAGIAEQQFWSDLDVAAGLLLGRGDVAPKRYGTIGFCMGGTLSIQMAQRRSEVGASVVYYGFPVNEQPRPGRETSPIDDTDKIQSPMIGFWGDAEQSVKMPHVYQFRQRLQELGKDAEVIVYPGAGHGFLAIRQAADAPAAEDSWPKTVQFLNRHLKGAAVGAR
ncbi:MAG: dienelactone hydrolase family protein [Chloroflexi bacterium]|nr:dienelactone hydrolase family protein [Chloroflexota bacterium]